MPAAAENVTHTHFVTRNPPARDALRDAWRRRLPAVMHDRDGDVAHGERLTAGRDHASQILARPPFGDPVRHPLDPVVSTPTPRGTGRHVQKSVHPAFGEKMVTICKNTQKPS